MINASNWFKGSRKNRKTKSSVANSGTAQPKSSNTANKTNGNKKLNFNQLKKKVNNL